MTGRVPGRDEDVAAVTFDHDDGDAVVVIGSGAGGGTLANELAQKGIDVVVLEAGPRYRLADFVNDEYLADEMFVWRDPRTSSGNARFVKDFAEAPTWLCKTVGGSTVHWVSNSFRFMEREFKPRTTYGAIPGANLLDWPITLADLLPYYERAESKMGVTGRGDVPYLPETNNFKVFALGARRLGYKRVTTSHLAINSVPRDGRNACDQIGFCMQGCKSGAKWSTLYTEIPKAEATGHCEVRANAMALQIEHDERGRVTGVLYADQAGRQHVQKARAVCVAGNAPETTRILLNSASGRFPHGLANSSGQLGKNYMRSVLGLVYGVFPKPVNMYRGPVGAGLIEDLSDNDPGKRGFVGGIWLGLNALGLPFLAGILKPKAWGREYAHDLEAYAHMSGLWFCGDDLPQERCAISLDKEVKDRHGLPVAHLHIDLHQNEIAMENWGFVKSAELYEAAGATKVLEEPPVACAHNLGTCRMSASARDGVVNKWGQTHDIPNLFIADGSVFTSNNTGNPTLTIVALAIRQADYLAQRLRANDL
ncbi:MAG: GMC family oxidoreductase [Alphaproteobacteria bacterium]|nr:GMC family oxidoreductase [Alphaproteobacteria bacterium]